MTAEFNDLTERFWRLATASGAPGSGRDVPPGDFTMTGPRAVLPSFFDVTGLATASVAAATLAAAEFLAARRETRPQPVTVDSRAACAAFGAEGLFVPLGWQLPEVWDPIAGNYLARDGWIRLHTNYAYHRAVVERLLDAHDADGVRAAVRDWTAGDLETAVVEAGGCAAAMHSREDWLASPPGAATASAPPLSVTESTGQATPSRNMDPGSRPFAGIRVLDLTRVIAGPVCTKFLAAYGADVLRIDPPGFAEVAALLPTTTQGKRTASLDLRADTDRARFDELVATADVLVTGLRGDALARLGYDDDALRALNPALILASLNAYGWEGPWRDRRGFDSLVQMSCGIAAAGAAAMGQEKPVPLPVQALDHGCGYLLAAAVGRALTRRITAGRVSRIRASLIGTANLLWSLSAPEGLTREDLPPMPAREDFALEDTVTAWGPARAVPVPGQISGSATSWAVEAGPLGRHAPAWADA
jgi:hypothetical protein